MSTSVIRQLYSRQHTRLLFNNIWKNNFFQQIVDILANYFIFRHIQSSFYHLEEI